MDEQPEVPNYFSDVFELRLSPYSASIRFGLTEAQAPGDTWRSRDIAVMRMSLEQAKVLAMLLRKNISRYERDHQVEVTLPPAVYDSLGVDSEDWPDPHGG
jgi:hypothetical protein